MRENGKGNVWLPQKGKIVQITDMAPEIKMFQVELLNGEEEETAAYSPGQFAFISAFGVGEAPFGIASGKRENGVLEFAVQRLGSVTTALHELGEGDVVGIRGPLGNNFPMEEFIGKNLLVLGGGIGGAPLRPVLEHIFAQRENYGVLTILWAARRPDLLMFRDEYDKWKKEPRTNLYLTVDEADGEWEGDVGLITDLLKSIKPSANNTVAITCGPPIMIYYADKVLEELGFSPENRFVTLEARMHCGIGKCGRCNIGEKLVCVDGPVFSMAQVGNFLESYL